MPRTSKISGLLLLALVGGCVQRSMSITSEPDGALVYLNGREAGRTPLQADFTWYGTYDVQLRKDGFETVKTRQRVAPPWWQIPPFDLVAEFFPLRDERKLSYPLTAASDAPADVNALISRSAELSAQIEAPEPRQR